MKQVGVSSQVDCINFCSQADLPLLSTLTVYSYALMGLKELEFSGGQHQPTMSIRSSAIKTVEGGLRILFWKEGTT